MALTVLWGVVVFRCLDGRSTVCVVERQVTATSKTPIEVQTTAAQKRWHACKGFGKRLVLDEEGALFLMRIDLQ